MCLKRLYLKIVIFFYLFIHINIFIALIFYICHQTFIKKKLLSRDPNKSLVNYKSTILITK